MKEIFRREFEAARVKGIAVRLTKLQQALTYAHENDRDPKAYREVARCHQAMHEYQAAIEILIEGIEHCPFSASLYRHLIDLFERLNCTSRAIQYARMARVQFPNDFGFVLLERLLLPRLYSSEGDLGLSRRAFTEGLRDLAGQLSLEKADACTDYLAGVGRHVNFMLAYQCRNDRELQATYGEMTHRIVTASFPQWARTVEMPPDDGRLRIGYISAALCHHSVSKSHLGWIQQQRRDRFRIMTYKVGRRSDTWTDDARNASDIFRELPDDLEESLRLMRADQPHVLVFLDIGMNARMMELAALRIAPIQCTTWGHPVTSGLPTVDYFLSSDLMEPPDGQNHYTEKLIRLPGIGVCYRKPVIPRDCFYRTRADFGIREDAVVYLSCQTTSKYLPQHDDIYPAIAKVVPNAQFVFIAHNSWLGEDFRRRLSDAFLSAGVAFEGRVVVAQKLDGFGYWNLNVVADVYLDTLDWSGCNSTFEAIACRLPVVTTPGRLMRGRHSYAILTQLGVTETIAADKNRYVEIAVRLGLEPEWRNHVVERLVAGHQKLFSDLSGVRALEKFYEEAVGAWFAQRPE